MTIRTLRRLVPSIWLAIMAFAGSALPALSQQSVTSFTLINADSDLDIGPLVDGDTLNLGSLPTTNLSVRANTDPEPVGSVRFAYDGNANFQTESALPYALAGDNSGPGTWNPKP